jgi:hypothetical protein
MLSVHALEGADLLGVAILASQAAGLARYTH